ncbi:10119_t:CDS:2, partial [Racocetra fulgida]
MPVTQPKTPKILSNRQKFRQILPSHETLREIEALNLGKPRNCIGNQFGKKVKIIGKKRLERKLGDLTLEREEQLEVRVLRLTQQINFYAAGNMFNMVDMPGYGFAYVKDEERIKWKELNVEFQIILTKCDLVIAPDLARRHTLVKEQLEVYRNAIPQPMMVSARRKSGIYKLRQLILTIVGGLERARE